MPSKLLLASAMSLAAHALAQEPAGGAGPVAVPPGRVAELFAKLPPDAKPAALGAPWPAWSDRSRDGWGGEPAWRRWVELVRAERDGASSPARRAELACLARMQGRDGDAWEHLLACSAEPGLVAALLPLFSPGVQPAELAQAGALSDGTLADGALLTPALPPSDEPRSGLRGLAGKRIERREFALGAARCSLAVSVDRDGLEVSVHHLAGAPARVRILPPLPLGVDPGVVFADWEKLPGHEGPLEFTLDAESPEHTLWLTFVPRTERWPAPPLAELSRGATGREIVLVSPRGDEPHLARFAEALSELLGVPASLHAPGFQSRSALEPLVLTFDEGPGAERKLLELLGALEAFALRTPIR